MLTLIEGGFFAPIREEIFRLIHEKIQKREKCYLIVPEPQTLATERLAEDLLPPSSTTVFEVTNFTRLADTVFRTVGGIAGEYARGAERSIIMYKALSELKPLSESGSINAGLVSKSLTATLKMQKLGITSEKLSECARSIEQKGKESDKRLIFKLNELSSVMALYKELLGKYFSDSEETLPALYKKLSTHGVKLFSDTEIFIEGFTSFTEPQRNIIKKLMEICPVTIALSLPPENRHGAEYREQRDSRDFLFKSAKEQGHTPTLKKIAAEYPPKNPIIQEILSCLWHTTVRKDSTAKGMDTTPLSIYECDTPYDECDFIAADIKKRVMAGARYSDFGIIARNLEEYEGLLASSFKSANIPIFLQKGKDITSFELIKLIYSAYRTVNGGYKRNDLISYSKCSLCGIPRSDRDEFELYAEGWQLNCDDFTKKDDWTMNPLGIGKRADENTKESLRRINETRRRLTAPLEELLDTKKDEPIINHAKSLWNFLLRLKVSEALEDRAKLLRQKGNEDDARDTEKLWSVVVSSLDSLVKLLGDTRVNSEAFLTLLKLAFEAETIGRLPSYKDRVATASADAARMWDVKHVYVVGANYGTFPAGVSTDPYFSETDKKTLESYSLPIKPENETALSRELYYFSRALSFGKESVAILYHNKNGSFVKTAPSEAIEAILEITGGDVKVKKLSEIPKLDLTYDPRYALEHIGDLAEIQSGVELALKETEYGGYIALAHKDIKNGDLSLSPEVGKTMLQADGSLSLTQSKIDKFVSCPLSYLCGYTLNLNPNERAELNAANIGSFIHEILEKYFKHVTDNGISYEDMAKERGEFIKKCATEFTAMSFDGVPDKSARMNYTISRLCRIADPILEGISKELSGSKFKPIFFELPIELDKHRDENSQNPQASVYETPKGHKVFIRGVIDRVDAYKKDGKVYVRVIDYKTGSKDFKYDDLKNGENLQMLLYLKSLVETDNSAFRNSIGAGSGEELIPAGVIYVMANVKDSKINSPSEEDALKATLENQTRQGMISNDENVIDAMHPDFLPIKKGKNGKIDLDTSPNILTEEKWKEIKETLKATVGSIGDRMISGDATATPMKHGKPTPDCQYCDFKAICRNVKH